MKFIYYWVPVIVYSISIFYVSSMEFPLRQLPFSHYDKALHLMEYGVFAWLWYRAFLVVPGLGRRWIWPIVIAITVLFGTLDETYQSTNPARTSDFYDLLADTLGAFLVMAVIMFKERHEVR